MLKELIEWSQHRYADLPWRQNRNLYTTLVSEIMLQQTTVTTVLKHYQAFLKRFPDILKLAQASEAEVELAWRGLGYYRRARNLHRAAKTIVTEYGGEIPINFDQLITIPGIGAYTASAIVSIGANQKALAVDANIERVVARLEAIDMPKGSKLQEFIRLHFLENNLLVGAKFIEPRALNEALMDLGRTVCQARRASCEICPVKKMCKGKRKPELYPQIVSKGDREQHELLLLRVIYEKAGKILAYQKTAQQWLSGQYEVPTFQMDGTDQKLNQYPVMSFPNFQFLPSIKTGITKYKIQNYVIFVNQADLEHLGITLGDYEWVDPAQVHLSTTSAKCLNL